MAIGVSSCLYVALLSRAVSFRGMGAGVCICDVPPAYTWPLRAVSFRGEGGGRLYGGMVVWVFGSTDRVVMLWCSLPVSMLTLPSRAFSFQGEGGAVVFRGKGVDVGSSHGRCRPTGGFVY